VRLVRVRLVRRRWLRLVRVRLVRVRLVRLRWLRLVRLRLVLKVKVVRLSLEGRSL
jgi:hypothetical protein